jgi:hypothetical protein
VTERVIATPEAEAVIERLKAVHGRLMFHQSGGCCDGSSPMCYPAGEFKVGGQDVRLGTIGGADFWMWAEQYAYFSNAQLIIDVVRGAAPASLWGARRGCASSRVHGCSRTTSCLSWNGRNRPGAGSTWHTRPR